MKVCVDIQPALAQRAGVGRYVKCLVEHLGAFAGSDHLNLFYFDFKRKGLSFSVPDAGHQAVRWVPGRLVQQAWKTLAWPPFDWFAGRADLYHFPNFIVPPLRQGRAVVTIHDLAFMRFPETIEPRNYDYLTSHIRETVARADAVIAVSAFTAREITECLGVPGARIFSIPEGLSGDMFPREDTEVEAMRVALGLHRPYLLTVGTLEPRKNISFLVDVFEQLSGFDGDLVVAGMPGWKYEPVLERMSASARARDIKYLHYVDDQFLAALYAGADVFVFPSLYEGFGFPPLEAMACGTPVLASAAGSLPEVLGDAALIVEGFDATTWSRALAGLLNDRARMNRLAARGIAHARNYSWPETARRTWEVYRGMVNA